MPTIVFIRHDGIEYRARAEVGQSVMQAALNASVPGILAECGGMLSCATCHGYIDPAWAVRLPAPSADERDMLQCVLDPRDESRLSCQLTVTEALDGLIVRLPKSQL